MKPIYVFLLLLGTVSAAAQRTALWTTVAEQRINLRSDGQRYIVPEKYETFRLDVGQLERLLDRAPTQGEIRSGASALRVPVPLPDGSLAPFQLYRLDNLHPELAARYSSIRSYQGTRSGHPGQRIRLSISSLGVHAVLQDEQGEIYIDPYQQGDRVHYVVYYTRDNKISPALREQIVHDHSMHDATPSVLDQVEGGRNSPFKTGRSRKSRDLLTYRIAIACSGEYAQFWGGDLEGALAAINVALDRINFVFVRDVGIRMELIAENDSLIYLDPDADPYDNADVGGSASKNGGVLNAVVGANAYDVGHVFLGPCGGGVVGTSAGVGTICGPSKGNGSSCQTAPNDNFYIGIVCHELGHQFGALHTWNNCPGSNDDPANYNPGSAYEPGSGTTIMSYASACGDQNIQGRADSYYHTNSLEAIERFSRTLNGSTCATALPTQNQAPVVELPLEGGFSIPVSTPFRLRASASDPDGDSTLTYCWEQYDKDPLLTPMGDPRGNEPLFRSLSPTQDPERIFPQLNDIIRNRFDRTEVLPDYGRDLTFRCTVRDNDQEAGASRVAQLSFKVSAQAGPFLVQYPDTASTLEGGSYTEIRWNVANTDQPPVNCRYVNIKLSTDGGQTYPITLLRNTPNDGTAFATLPNIESEQVRFMIEAADNIFFDISNQDSQIVPTQDTNYTVDILPSAVPLLCLPETVEVQIPTTSLNGFDSLITLDLEGVLPAGSTFDISPNPVTPGDTALLSLQVGAVLDQRLDLQIIASSNVGDSSRQRPLIINALSNDFSDLALQQPADGSAGILLSTILGWTGIPNADSYDVQLSDSPIFGETTLEAIQQLEDTSYTPDLQLENNTLYYWRVRPNNDCGPGEYLSPATFHTASTSCERIDYTGDPINISGTGRPTIESTLNVDLQGSISDLNIPLIDLTYQPINVLRITVVSPAGTEVVVFNRNCFTSNTILEVGFDDDAPELISCPPISGRAVQPTEPLAGFNGESASGTWILRIEVVGSGFGASGALQGWGLEFCTSNTPDNPVLQQLDTLFVPPAARNTITTDQLQVVDSEQSAEDLLYTLVEAPQQGELRAYGVTLQVGDQFTQAAIETFDLQYFHDVDGSRRDDFLFVVEDGTGGFLAPQRLPIVIDEGAVVSTRKILPASALDLFPNPARQAVQLRLRGDLASQQVHVSLYHSNGALMRAYTPAIAASRELDISGMAAGLYLLRVWSESGQLTRKLYIQR